MQWRLSHLCMLDSRISKVHPKVEYNGIDDDEDRGLLLSKEAIVD